MPPSAVAVDAERALVASVDVVVPNYNYARFLPECVQSVLAQGMDDAARRDHRQRLDG